MSQIWRCLCSTTSCWMVKSSPARPRSAGWSACTSRLCGKNLNLCQVNDKLKNKSNKWGRCRARWNGHLSVCLSVCRSSVTKEGGAERILQFVSTFNNSRLGSHLQKLSDGDRLDYARRYLHDFLLLSLKIKSKEELKVQILSVIFQ